jgi:hypothetical protein
MPSATSSQNAPAPPNVASKTGNVWATSQFEPQFAKEATLIALPRMFNRFQFFSLDDLTHSSRYV